MDQEFLIWNARGGGWMTASATYSSELDKAKLFSYSDALAMAKRSFNKHTGGVGFIPVPAWIRETLRDER